MAKTTPALSLSDFKAAEKQPGPRCWYEAKLTDDEHRRAVTEAIEAGHTHGAISRVLKDKLNISVSKTQVQHHFSGDCRCGKS